MANNSIALGVEVPDFGNSFARGAAASQDRQLNSMKMQMAEREQGREEALQMMQMLGSAGMYALDGRMDGEADPAKWDEAMDGLTSMGFDASQYKGKPQMASALVGASLSTSDRIKMAQNDRDFELALRKFDADLSQNAQSMAFRREGLDLQRQRLAGGDAPPKGYRRSASGDLEAIPGGPADPSNPLNTKKVTGQTLSPTAQKELFEAEDMIAAGEGVISGLDEALTVNDQAMSGPMAGARGRAASWVGMESGKATEKLKNIVTAQALDNLRATFGGNPTEGERGILIEIQGSVDQAPEVRADIFKRAKKLAERRVRLNKEKASQIRSGDYFSERPTTAEQSSNGEPTDADLEALSDAELEALINGE